MDGWIEKGRVLFLQTVRGRYLDEWMDRQRLRVVLTPHCKRKLDGRMGGWIDKGLVLLIHCKSELDE